ncbi:uncharacterized protein J3R85_010751 [Psidium guajava]|nr:uncharacterized protein J3R85_010751 [Psidium guajava]
MKKMKGIAVMESSPYAAPEDPRIRYKHRSLMQDYQDLEKETNAMKKKMDMLKQHKFTLLAEVQFLRRRCKYLMESQLSSPQQPHSRAKRKNIEVKSDNLAKARNTAAKVSAQGKSASVLDLNKKRKVKNGRKAALQDPMLLLNAKEERTIVGREAAYHNSARSLDLNEKDFIASGREVTIQNPNPVFDMHHKERLRAGREVTKRNPTPVFDLNQISTEELQINDQQPRSEEVNRSLGTGEGEELNNDVKLSSFRTKSTANGLSKVGKRKISWQDQVALRV